jgi:hypothetical protein
VVVKNHYFGLAVTRPVLPNTSLHKLRNRHRANIAAYVVEGVDLRSGAMPIAVSNYKVLDPLRDRIVKAPAKKGVPIHGGNELKDLLVSGAFDRRLDPRRLLFMRQSELNRLGLEA